MTLAAHFTLSTDVSPKTTHETAAKPQVKERPSESFWAIGRRKASAEWRARVEWRDVVKHETTEPAPGGTRPFERRPGRAHPRTEATDDKDGTDGGPAASKRA